MESLVLMLLLVRRNITMTSKIPSFFAYVVKDRPGRRPLWTKIGTVWGHEKGTGFNVELQALPMDGRIVLMPPPTEEASEAINS
jgi:hypothetical protein